MEGRQQSGQEGEGKQRQRRHRQHIQRGTTSTHGAQHAGSIGTPPTSTDTRRPAAPLRVAASADRRSTIVNTRSKWRMLLKSIEVGPARVDISGPTHTTSSPRPSDVSSTNDGADSTGGSSAAGGGAGSEAGGGGGGSEGAGVAWSASNTSLISRGGDSEGVDSRADSSGGGAVAEGGNAADLATLSALEAALDAVGSDAQGVGAVGGVGDEELMYAAAADADSSLLGAAASQMAADLRREGEAHGPLDGPLAKRRSVGAPMSPSRATATGAGTGGDRSSLSPSSPPLSPLQRAGSGTGMVTADVVLRRSVRQEVWCDRAASMASNYPPGTFAKLHRAPTPHERRIRRDVGRTFAAFGAPPADEDVLRALRYMLRAMSLLDGELGYCQGLNFVAAMALKEVGEETGFWVMAYLMEEQHLRMLYLSTVPYLSMYINAFEQYMGHYVPRVRAHLASQNFLGTLYAVEWFTTLYACNLPVEGAMAAATMIMLQIDNSLFRIGTAILHLMEDRILSMDMEGLMTTLKTEVQRMDVKRIIHQALSYPPQPDVLLRMADAGPSSLMSTPRRSRDMTAATSGADMATPTSSPGGTASTPSSFLTPTRTTRSAGSRRQGLGAVRGRHGMRHISSGPHLSADRLMRAHVGSLWSRCSRAAMLAEHDVKYSALLRSSTDTDKKIGLDVARTAGSVRFGVSVSPSPAARAKDRDLAQALHRVLHCMAVLDPEMGYSQGMNFLAQALVKEAGEERGFWLMRRLFTQHNLRCLYMSQQPTLPYVLQAFDEYITEHCPRVAAHLRRHNFLPALYAVEWFTTVFTCNLPEVAVKCAVSMMLAGWDNVLLRVGAAVLQCMSADILSMGEQKLLKAFKGKVMFLNSFDVISAAVIFPPVDDVLTLIAKSPNRAARARVFSGVGGGLGLRPARGSRDSLVGLGDEADAGAGPRSGPYTTAGRRRRAVPGRRTHRHPDTAKGQNHGDVDGEEGTGTSQAGTDIEKQVQWRRSGSGEVKVDDARRPHGSMASDLSYDDGLTLSGGESDADSTGRRGRGPASRGSGSVSGTGTTDGPDGRRRRQKRRARRLYPADVPTDYALSDVRVRVKKPVQCKDCTGYVIEVRLQSLRWRRIQRYSAFDELHEQWWGSKEPAFVHKRCKELDRYLRTLLSYKDLGGPHNEVFVREFIAPAELGDEHVVIGRIPYDA